MSANPQGYQIVRAAGMAVTVSTSITRPADTSAYAAGDAVADSTSAPDVLTFSNVARYKGGSGMVLGAQLIDNSAPGTAGLFELLLFTTAITPTNDNAALSISAADGLTYVGMVPFYTSKTATNVTLYSPFAAGDAHPFVFICASTSQNLYGVLRAANAYTPKSGGLISIKLVISQD